MNYKVNDIIRKIRLYLEMIDKARNEKDKNRNYYFNGMAHGYLEGLKENKIITYSSYMRLNKIILKY